MTITLANYLASAGLGGTAKTAEKEPEPKPAKTAAEDNANGPGSTPTPAGGGNGDAEQPSTEPKGGKDPRDSQTDAETQDTGATGGETAAASTPAKKAEAEAVKTAFLAKDDLTEYQKQLAERGLYVEDAKVAERIVDNEIKIAEQQKRAEVVKVAEELRNQGRLMYQGMIKQSCATRVAMRQCTEDDLKISAVMADCDPGEIIKIAEELAAAMPDRGILVEDDLGRAADVNSSRTMQAGEVNANTTDYRPEATEETRQPTSGQDEKTKRFVDVWPLPGNPGVNHGQKVDQGKGYGQ